VRLSRPEPAQCPQRGIGDPVEGARPTGASRAAGRQVAALAEGDAPVGDLVTHTGISNPSTEAGAAMAARTRSLIPVAFALLIPPKTDMTRKGALRFAGDDGIEPAFRALRIATSSRVASGRRFQGIERDCPPSKNSATISPCLPTNAFVRAGSRFRDGPGSC
jgi:hypothetical protein